MTAARKRQRRERVAAAAPRSGWDWRLPSFLAAVFLLKLVVLVQLQHHPLLEPEGSLDTAAYASLARRVLAGDLWLGPGLYYVSPLYIYVLAALLGLSDSFTFVRLVQIALGTVAVACVFWTARAWFGSRAAWIAAALAALTGEFTFYEIVVFQSSLDAFLTAAALLCLTGALVDLPPNRLRQGYGGSAEAVRAKAEGSHAASPVASGFSRKAAAAGLLLGLQILNRPNIVVAVAGVVLTLLLIRRLRIAGLLVAGVLIALAPIAIRNAVVAHQLALAGSQGGLNFYIGNHAQATGQYVEVPGVRANMEGQSEDTRKVAEQATGRTLDDGQVSAYFTRLALDWLREHPAAGARLFVKKLALVFNARHQWLDFSYPYYAYDTGSILWMLFVGPWLLVPLGISGLVWSAFASAFAPSALRRDSPSVAQTPGSPLHDFVAWGSFVPFYALSIAVFFVAERYRLPLFVPLCVTGAASVELVLQAFPKRSPDLAHRPSVIGPRSSARAAAAVAAVAIAAAALTAWPFDIDSGRYDERLRLSKVLMNRGDYGEAALVLEDAHRLQPEHTVAEFNLGMALAAQGRAQEGLAHLRHAVAAGVPVKGARYALASTLQATGEHDEAVRLLRSYQPQPEDDAMSCLQVARLAMDAGVPDAAARYARRALELRPDWSEAQRVLAEATSRIPR
jgi:4-amino-4-deoxy-L-arabinose transferase-like glycosyltransferase